MLARIEKEYPNVVLYFAGKRIILAAGLKDYVTVYEEDNDVYVLNKNNRYGYVGMQVFNTEGEEIHNVFLQGDSYPQEYANLGASELINELVEYCY